MATLKIYPETIEARAILKIKGNYSSQELLTWCYHDSVVFQVNGVIFDLSKRQSRILINFIEKEIKNDKD